MKVIIFNQRVKHDGKDFIPNAVNYGFETDAVADFFVAAGWAAETTDPAHITYAADEVAVDSQTRFANGPNAGQLVIHDSILGSQ